MTGCSIVAKLLAIAMGVLALLVLSRIARRTVSTAAGRWAVFWGATSLSFAYYGRISNLDGPYLMWTVLAMDRLLTVAETRKRRDYVIFGILAGAAVATKDQAYAGFVLPAVIYLLLLPLRGDQPFGSRAEHYKHVGVATVSGALSLGLLGGGLLNPTGFVVRLSELTGSASRDWSVYERTPAGFLLNLRHLVESQEAFFWPWPVVALCWVGIAWVLWNRGGAGLQSRTFRLLPFIAALSSVFFFTLIVGFCQHRFLLPFGFWLSYYGGVASAELVSVLRARGTGALRVGQMALAALVVWAGAHSFELHLTQLGDARWQVQDYLQTLDPGTTVETYGRVVQLPHFDRSDASPYRVQRVDRRPIDERAFIPGFKEIDPPYGEVSKREPDVLIVPENHAKEFIPHDEIPPGMKEREAFRMKQADADGQAFFRAVLDDSLDGYALVFVAGPTLPAWASTLGAEPVVIHGSTGSSSWVLRKTSDHR